MRSTIYHPLPDIKRLPDALHAERSVRIELEEGVPVLKDTRSVQARIEQLVSLEQEGRLSPQQAEEGVFLPGLPGKNTRQTHRFNRSSTLHPR
jgi:hypothetical protein